MSDENLKKKQELFTWFG